jgi:hypothetical protein
VGTEVLWRCDFVWTLASGMIDGGPQKRKVYRAEIVDPSTCEMNRPIVMVFAAGPPCSARVAATAT